MKIISLFLDSFKKKQNSSYFNIIIYFFLSYSGASFTSGCFGSCPPGYNKIKTFFILFSLSFSFFFILYWIIILLKEKIINKS